MRRRARRISERAGGAIHAYVFYSPGLATIPAVPPSPSLALAAAKRNGGMKSLPKSALRRVATSVDEKFFFLASERR